MVAEVAGRCRLSTSSRPNHARRSTRHLEFFGWAGSAADDASRRLPGRSAGRVVLEGQTPRWRRLVVVVPVMVGSAVVHLGTAGRTTSGLRAALPAHRSQISEIRQPIQPWFSCPWHPAEVARSREPREAPDRRPVAGTVSVWAFGRLISRVNTGSRLTSSFRSPTSHSRSNWQPQVRTNLSQVGS